MTISMLFANPVHEDPEAGQALVEYALIISLVTLLCLVSLQLVSTNLATLLDSIQSAVAGAI